MTEGLTQRREGAKKEEMNHKGHEEHEGSDGGQRIRALTLHLSFVSFVFFVVKGFLCAFAPLREVF
jgi:hypothetical protein